MKIQLIGNLDKAAITNQLKNAQIVDDGDFLLYEKVERISVSDGYDISYIAISDILYIEAGDGMHSVYTVAGVYQTNERLKSLELGPLFRISKSTLVNLNRIENVKVKINMRYALKIKGVWLDVNRTYYNSFKERLGL